LRRRAPGPTRVRRTRNRGSQIGNAPPARRGVRLSGRCRSPRSARRSWRLGSDPWDRTTGTGAGVGRVQGDRAARRPRVGSTDRFGRSRAAPWPPRPTPSADPTVSVLAWLPDASSVASTALSGGEPAPPSPRRRNRSVQATEPPRDRPADTSTTRSVGSSDRTGNGSRAGAPLGQDPSVQATVRPRGGPEFHAKGRVPAPSQRLRRANQTAPRTTSRSPT
jgi:hypothetical protein